MANLRVCSIPGCGKPLKARGWCDIHWWHWKRYGDPLQGKHAKRGEPLAFFSNVALKHDADECLIWPFARDNNGYGKITIDGRNKSVGRAVCEHIHGPASSEYDAAHSCGNGHLGCCAPKHLSWKTRTQNVADAIAHGTWMHGEKSPHAKLTVEIVKSIRSLRGKMRQRDIAGQYNISQSHVAHIMSGRLWASVPG